MSAYYNEFEPYCAQWLRNLIDAGHLPAGDVDERDMREVSPDDLKGYDQCHFFAGIGGWPYALRLAGWPDDRPVWTGSCPCQPLSSAGQRKGHADERHLWPAFYALIAERRPAIVFGEQVASKLGREWVAGVRADMEDLGDAVGIADLCSAGVGAPNIRQRIWWLAYADGGHASAEGLQRGGQQRQQPQDGRPVDRLADTDKGQWGRLTTGEERERDRQAAGRQQGNGQPQPSGATSGLAQPNDQCGRQRTGRADRAEIGDGSRANFWSDFDLIACTDGKARRVEPGTFPLAHGVQARVGKLRAYGNAINPWPAVEFITASREVIDF